MNLRIFLNILALILVLLGLLPPAIFTKAIMIIVGVAIFIINNYVLKKEKEEKEEIDYKINALNYEIQKQRLIGRGIPERYINGLGKNPLFQHTYQTGEEHERKGQYEEAIEKYKEILANPLSDEENRVAIYNLIGFCHFSLFEFGKAMKNFQMALNIVKNVKVKEERLRSKAATLTNIGLIYQELGQWKNAIRCHKNALGLHCKLDNKLGKANTLYNIYLVYLYLNKPKKALKKVKEAIPIFQEVLEIYNLDHFPMDYATTQSNLGVAYGTLAQVQDKAENCNLAIKAYQEALKVYTLDRFPMDYTETQNNLGVAYGNLAEVQEDKPKIVIWLSRPTRRL